jgi:hypothetical protein
VSFENKSLAAVLEEEPKRAKWRLATGALNEDTNDLSLTSSMTAESLSHLVTELIPWSDKIHTFPALREIVLGKLHFVSILVKQVKSE